MLWSIVVKVWPCRTEMNALLELLKRQWDALATSHMEPADHRIRTLNCQPDNSNPTDLKLGADM